MILNLNLFAVEIPSFKNKIAIIGEYITKINENEDLERITFYQSYYDENTDTYKTIYEPYTNTFFFERVNQFFTNIDRRYFSATSIFIDYDKYGKKYIENLIKNGLDKYTSKDFEGKYISVKGQGTNGSFQIIDSGNYEVRAILDNNTISLLDSKGQGYSILDDESIIIELNILDTDTLIVFEQSTDKVLGFKGIYTKVKE